MKRQVIAVLLGSLFALPAFANAQIDGETGMSPTPAVPAQFAGKSRAEVRAELEQAVRSGRTNVDGEIGAASWSAQAATKSRNEVRAELVQAYRTGAMNIDGEIGSAATSL